MHQQNWWMAKKNIKIHQQSMINGKWIIYKKSSIGLIANKLWKGIFANLSIKKSLICTICIRGCSQTTFTRFWLFLTTYPRCVYILYGINVGKKWTFLDHLPTLSCKDVKMEQIFVVFSEKLNFNGTLLFDSIL